MQIQSSTVIWKPIRSSAASIKSMVADPHWFNADPDTDPDPAIFPGSGSRVWWPKVEKNVQLEIQFLFSWSKIVIYLSLGLHKGRQSYRRSLQPSTSSTSKHENSVLFSIFLWVSFALLDPDPDPATQINADSAGSGSANLGKRAAESQEIGK